MTSQWPRRRLKSPASRLFTQSFIRAQIKENIKTLRHWPLCGEFTGTGEFPAQRPVTRKMFPFDDVIMYKWVDIYLGNYSAEQTRQFMFVIATSSWQWLWESYLLYDMPWNA